MKEENHKYINTNYHLPKHQFSVGGDIQKVIDTVTLLSKIQLNKKPSFFGMENVYYNHDVKTNYVFYPQLDPRFQQSYDILDPKKLTFEDIKNHAIIHQNKDELGTVRKQMNYLAKMAAHPIYPIDFNNPDWEQYFHYMDYIKIHGDNDKHGRSRPVGIHGLLNRDEAWNMYLRSIGMSHIIPRYKHKIDRRKIPDNTLDKPIPQPEIVHKMLNHAYILKRSFDRNYKYLKNKGIQRRDLNKYIQYLLWFGFFIGCAPEKEWVILNLDDIIDNFDRYCIRITRPKVGNKKRILPLESVLSKSPVHKSMGNFLKIRDKIAESGEKALIANPKNGKRYGYHPGLSEKEIIHKGCDELRRDLSTWGKQVYPQFYPYLMRHWCGTARMIEWDKKGGAFDKVNFWLGHSDPSDTKIYCQLQRLFDQDKGSWLSRALKQDWLGGLDGSKKGNTKQIKNKNIVRQNNRGIIKEHPQARFYIL